MAIKPTSTKTKQKTIGSVLVVGGGVGGIQSSLDLADSGFKVYLVEQKPAIGGVMAQLDKTFPTNDCSMCILSPKLVEVGRHPNIELLTYSEIQDVDGAAGNFTVKIKKKATFVDEDKCTGCGDCTKACRLHGKINSRFEEGLGKRGAIYMMYPQAVPLRSVIDSENCLMITRGKCGTHPLCVEACKADAIDFKQKDSVLTVNVGSIILSPGYEKYPPGLKGEYGYGRFPNVINSLEFERMLSASGPYQGHVQRPSDKKEPHKIAWINCVGSRDRSCGNNYCSAVCCTYSIKEAVIAKEHLSSIEPTIFFMDMRTYGKGFEEYYQRAKNEQNIHFVRCRISEINQNEDTKSLLLKYETEEGKLVEEEFDMVVLSVGLTPNENAKILAEKLDIGLNEFGFSETPELHPIETTRKGVFVSGVFSGPKDIPETVIESSGAAAKAIGIISSERNKNVEQKTYPKEIDISGQQPRIGAFICHCGINIGAYVDVPAVVEYAKTLDNVEYAEQNLYTCSQDTQKKIVETIKENKLNRIIIASCTPRTHEPLFQETLREAGLNPHLFEMANIRDQCSWVHMDDKKGATEKAKDLMKMAVAKARLIQPLDPIKVDITQKALIIGGGLAGMTSALAIADQGFEVFLVEKDEKLGGNLTHINYTLKNSNIQQYLKDLVQKVKRHNKITVYTNATIKQLDGFVGNFKTTIANGDYSLDVKHGIVIVATGAQEAKPDEYLYGKNPNVFTQKQLEEKIANGASFKKKTIVMIQCVGSRDDQRPYCCRIGCSIAIKNALKIKKQHPDAEVYILYRDVRTYGFMETYYEQAREQGVIFIRYEPEEKPCVKTGKNDVEVEIRDIILDEKILLHADHVILSSAIVPREENRELAQLLKVPLNEDGFFLEAHVKLRPVDFATDGIFLAGMAHFPKTVEETLSQAYAATSRATKLLSKKQLEIEPRVSSVDETKCIGCGLCVSLCPSNAIELNLKEEGRKATVIAASCKGCGLCGASCPQQAITMRHFRDLEIAAQIKAYAGG